MHRLRAEISTVMGDSESPNREQIRRMPYLARVIKESKQIPESWNVPKGTDR